MQRDYDLFERFPDGAVLWRGHVNGMPEVRRGLAQLAATTANECFAIHLSTQEIVARTNVGHGHAKATKRLVGQIGYDQKLSTARTVLLRDQGYEVVSVIGNDAAKLLFDLSHDWNLFVVGHGAPKEVRAEMVSWLKRTFPGVPVLALNPPAITVLEGADYNVELNGSDAWLGLIGQALSIPPESTTARP